MHRFAPLFVLAAMLLPAPALAGGLKTGIVDPMSLGQGSPAIGTAADQAYSVGARTVRMELTWKAVSPLSRPTPDSALYDPATYNWGAFNNLIQQVRQRGLEPQVFIVRAPTWASGSGGPGPSGTNEPVPWMLGAFATAAAKHYKGIVRRWEVWNEPNGEQWLSPQWKNGKLYSPTLYRKMVNAVANAVHGVDHRNVVIAGGTQPFGFDKHVTRPNVFLRHVLCLNKYLHPYCRSTIQFDAWSTHPYTYGAPTHHAAHKDDVSIGDLPEMGRVLKAGLHYHKIRNWARDARKKAGFIVTEISWDTWRPDPKAVPARMQARWVSLALYRMWRAGVGRVYWFMIKDQPMNDGAGAPPTDLWQSGFYSSTGTLKPYARQAFRFPFVANNRRGVLSVWGRIPPGVHTRSVAIERKTSGGWRRITYARVHAGVFSKSWRSSLAHGAVRARWHGSASLPYSLLKRESSKIYYPFGCGGTRSCS